MRRRREKATGGSGPHPLGLVARAALALCLAAAWLAPGDAGAARETARGRVFEDLDGDGVADPGEPGIAGARVSDGERIVQTDLEGRYEIELEAPTVLFLTQPRGYQVPVDENQLPRFYYIHQPEGSPPGLRYPGVEPTGPLPEAIDFPLRRVEQATRFEALLFSDPQPQTEAELGYIRDSVVADLVGHPAAFGMTLGDILFDDLSMFPRYNALIAQIGVPWYNVPGNHEMNFEAPDDATSLETFKRRFGPPYYSFEVGDALFVVLDNIEYQGHGEADPADVRGAGGYVARIGKRQLAWLKRELAYVEPERLVFLAMHAPLESYLGDAPGITTQDRRALFRLLSGRPNLYSVAGHTHTTEHHYFGEEDGFKGPGEFHHHILSVVSGSWWSGPFDAEGIPVSPQRDGTPRGYHVLEVDGSDLSVRFQGAGLPADRQMRILYDVAHHGLRPDALRDFRAGELFDGHIDRDHVAAAEILVNLFDGGPRSQVSFRVGEGAFQPMARVSRADPVIAEIFARHADTKKSWVKARPSSHLWAADLPDDLPPGTHTVEVRAVDEFGRTHHAHSILEIR